MAIFKYLLPQVGMVYPFQKDFLSKEQRDEQVTAALKQAGIIDTGPGASDTTNKKAVDKALADLFTLVAQPYVTFHLPDEDVNLPGMTQRTGSWVRHIAKPVFTQLIQSLINARVAWYKNPSEPFETNQHSATARKIDVFMDSVEGQVDRAISTLFDNIGEYSVKEYEEDSGEQAGATASSNADRSGSGLDVVMMDVAAVPEEELDQEKLRKGVEAIDIGDNK
ncbi:hypothetical protein F5Y05DRAFT_413465 [Hypoxylon sp. FL0543]|nr:hypothetical protein F5Y05DRAFT_413465 [Hypoxylon sp. FL0543]